MEEQKREFKGIWIPAEIWLDDRLNALDKVIFAEIDSYSNSERGCFAGNDYLASFCQCSESKISKTISKLIELGYVKRVSFDGRQRVLQSCIVKFTTLNSNNCDSDKQNLPHNNPLNNPCNNIYNNSPYIPKGDDCGTELVVSKKQEYVEGFDAFYALYPKHVGKAAALKAWNKLKPNAELQEIMAKALMEQKQSAQWNKDGGQYIPNPATWLNQHRWEDEVKQYHSSAVVSDDMMEWARQFDMQNGNY